jgi:hypothetical protein
MLNALSNPLEPTFSEHEENSAEAARSSRLTWHKWKMDSNYRAQVGLAGDVTSTWDSGSPVGPPLKIQVIDTPGGESSDNADDDNMADVLDFLASGHIRDLSAIVVATKCGAPFSTAWQQQVKRYWDQFPMLRGQWIFMHTNADPLGVNAKERCTNESCFELDNFMRQKDMFQVLRSIIGHGAEAVSHMYVENNVPQNEFGDFEPGAETIKYHKAEAQNRLFNLVASFPPVPLSTMEYIKSKNMLHIDALIETWITSEQGSINTTLDETGIDKDRCMEQIKDCLDRMLELAPDIFHTQQEVDEMDSDRPRIVKQERLFSKWHRFRRPQASGTLTTQYPVLGTHIVSDPHFSRVKEVSNELTSKGHGTIEWSVTIKGDMWQPISCDMVMTTRLNDYYREQIQAGRNSLQRLERQLLQSQEEKDRLTHRVHDKAQILQATWHRMLRCTRVLGSIRQKMSLYEYQKKKGFYTSAVNNEWSGEECFKKYTELFILPETLPEESSGSSSFASCEISCEEEDLQQSASALRRIVGVFREVTKSICNV